MRRLLPDFFRPQHDHPAGSAAAESLNSALRSLHEPEIIDAKRACRATASGHPARRRRASSSSPRTTPTPGSSAVNDVRLALGTMLEIGPEGPDRLPPDHPMAGHLDVYQWLTVLQEYLVLGLMGKPIR